MLYVMLSNGSTRTIPEAETARVEGGQLVCRDARGLIVARFDAPLVSAYGQHQALAGDFSSEKQKSRA